MYKVNAYKGNINSSSAKLKQLPIKRDWMHSPTYNCYPLSFANTIGYGVYFEDDISFIWDGTVHNPAEGIVGKDHVWSGRGEGTVSFDTNLIFKTEEDVSMMTMPAPNYFIEGTSVVTTIVSTSFFTGSFPIVWKLDQTLANKEVFIKAGTIIACILPISVKQFDGSNINIFNETFPSERIHNDQEYIKLLKTTIADGKYPKLYKKGIDHNENKIGEHEVENLTMTVTYIEENK